MQAETGTGEGKGVPDAVIWCRKRYLASPQDMQKKRATNLNGKTMNDSGGFKFDCAH
jgi:hypothetical protein